MATITKRATNQWQAKIRHKGYPTQSKTFQSKASAERWAKMIEAEMDAGTFVSRTESEITTLEEAFQRYLKEITPHKKGARKEENKIKAWMARPLAKHFLAGIRGSHLATFRDERLAEGKSPSTVRNELNIISHLFTIAKTEWGMENLSNPVQNMRRPKEPAGRDRRLHDGEEDLLLGASDYPIKPLIILALETGMRLGELLSLTRENISLTRATATLLDTKNGERRVVPLSTKARETIKNLPTQISGKLFPSITSSAVSHQFKTVCNRVEIEGLRFHDLRHEATSRLFERGLDIMEVAAITGHKTLTMLKRYTHLKAEDLAKKLG